MSQREKAETRRRNEPGAGPACIVRTPVGPGQARPAPGEGPRRSCYDCVFCLSDAALWLRTLMSGFPVAGMCANHPDTPGQLREVPHGGPCRNFRPRPRPQGTELPEPPNDEVRYIPLTRGLHALVDAKNYEWLSRHKWSAHDVGRGKAQYAVRGCKGRT